jgi:hypothetical protein
MTGATTLTGPDGEVLQTMAPMDTDFDTALSGSVADPLGTQTAAMSTGGDGDGSGAPGMQDDALGTDAMTSAPAGADAVGGIAVENLAGDATAPAAPMDDALGTALPDPAASALADDVTGAMPAATPDATAAMPDADAAAPVPDVAVPDVPAVPDEPDVAPAVPDVPDVAPAPEPDAVGQAVASADQAESSVDDMFNDLG